MLNTLLETNSSANNTTWSSTVFSHDPNSSTEANFGSADSSGRSSTTNYMADPERMVEIECVKRVRSIIATIVKAAEVSPLT